MWTQAPVDVVRCPAGIGQVSVRRLQLDRGPLVGQTDEFAKNGDRRGLPQVHARIGKRLMRRGDFTHMRHAVSKAFV